MQSADPSGTGSRRAVSGKSALELIRRASRQYPDFFAPALEKIGRLDSQMFKDVIAGVPDDWMTQTAREFALALMCYNVQELRKLAL